MYLFFERSLHLQRTINTPLYGFCILSCSCFFTFQSSLLLCRPKISLYCNFQTRTINPFHHLEFSKFIMNYLCPNILDFFTFLQVLFHSHKIQVISLCLITHCTRLRICYILTNLKTLHWDSRPVLDPDFKNRNISVWKYGQEVL